MRYSYDVCKYSLMQLIYWKVHIINRSVSEDSVIIFTTLTSNECLHQSLYTEHRSFLVKAESSNNLFYKHTYYKVFWYLELQQYNWGQLGPLSTQAMGFWPCLFGRRSFLCNRQQLQSENSWELHKSHVLTHTSFLKPDI